MTLTAQERARKIKIIIFDVDGVWTDGTIWLIPGLGGGAKLVKELDANANHDIGFGVQSDTLTEAKGYCAHDGIGISLARLGGMKCGIITKRISETVATRASDLKIEYIYQGQAFKMKPVGEICEKEGITVDEIAYVGDDIIDLPVMRNVGLAIATANARQQVKAMAHYVTPNRGGYGAGRDAVEFILEAKGILEQCIETYLDADNPLWKTIAPVAGGDSQ
jgi:3-deoxy-D-manno-octulosonate 8-phosphate phosphatase (KDO 8-P phosphatase)